jgi:DNA invertase Pin-like site-specific DNA recombinase
MDRVAAYVRVSTAKQAEEDSHVRQRETLQNYVENSLEGDIEIDFYEDIAESGQNLDRDAYEDMMDSVEEYDAVLVRELSRFGRSLQKMLNDIEHMEEHDCSFISVKDDMIDTSSAQGQLMLNIIGAFNQFWADLARERRYEQIERRREEGKPIGRPKKLSEEQREYLSELRESENLSYSTLAAIAKEKWDVELHRQTVARYMKEDN